MSLETPSGKAVLKFLNEFDANIRNPILHDARSSKAFEGKGTPEPSKRKATESFDIPSKEKKRSPSPQRISDWEFFRMKEQITNYKMEISQLESRLRSQGEMRVESEVVAAKEIQRLENERMSDRAELKQLKYLTERLKQGLSEKEEEMQEAVRKCESEKSLAESKYISAQGEIFKLKDALKEAEEARNALTQQMSSLKADMAKGAQELEEEKMKHAKMDYTFRKKMRDALFAQKDFEARAINAERKVQELTQERDLLSESLKQVRSTAAWVIKEAELEKELKKAKLEVKSLRDALQDKLLLEEFNNTLQEKVSSLESLLKDSAELEAAKNELAYKLKEWQTIAELMCNATGVVPESSDQAVREASEFSLVSARKALSAMQMKEAELTSELLEAQSKIKELQAYKTTVASGSESLKAQIKTLTNEKAEVASMLEVARRKIKLVSQERDNYRQLLDSMEQDMTLSAGAFNAALGGGSQQRRPGGPVGVNKATRVEELELIIEKYQKNMETLEAELIEEKKKRKAIEEANSVMVTGKYSEEDMLRKIKEAVDDEKAKLEKELEVLWKEKEEARKEAERLSAHVDQLEGELEHRALKGDFNPKGTKVVHFKMNPAALASEKYVDELEAYKSECERLRERVKVLEEKQQLLKERAQGSSTIAMDGDLLPCDDSSALEVTKVVEARIQAQGSKEIEELREQLRQAKLLPERLKEAFKMKIKDFRDACYCLFGYKLKLIGVGRWSLYSMYAESPEDHLLFEISSSGLPSLLETPFSATLEDLIRIHLMRQHSFPAFLSAVTLDLFNRQTMS
ncbi:mitotic spindle assembly checkpoint protein MAD1 [Ischnura elegans]|uniref:mitotic spindle assembly checkpoint protein MAD1 n=1 Tax=Ischnura elegans TaxID=197161 RepID=UPI001ED88B29|nr:mitotic spindle assembly checkpoint protein MAD1 [Ischnura elegans]